MEFPSISSPNSKPRARGGYRDVIRGVQVGRGDVGVWEQCESEYLGISQYISTFTDRIRFYASIDLSDLILP